MKCQRCGNDETKHEGHIIDRARGSDATEHLTLKGKNGIIAANVCAGCSVMLQKLGWRKTQ